MIFGGDEVLKDKKTACVVARSGEGALRRWINL
jgi:hypothetical protein